jgi:predicted helicase
MSSPAIDRLRGIKTLPQLVAYLRDELDWPISSNNTEDITFDYEPSELGLDKETAVKIKEIKQLRPLTGNQPWGIFFVNFEKKRLPVMVMRRILRTLVFKKRTAPGKSDRQAWHASDLLFISAYGEEHDRAITFAHFVEDEELGGLAELRVLGWDDDDTPLKYDYVAHTLHDKFRWRGPFDRDPDMWRKTWRDAFELRHREVITTSKQLALNLAALAKKIRSRVQSILRYEDGFGQIRKLQAAFRKTLIHDLSDDDFADMYAQTITYGLFSAAVSRPAGIHGENIVDMVPVTNPFLRDMLETFLNLSGRKGKIDFDELGIQEVTSLLNSRNTHLDAVLRDFDNRNPQEDPVVHFYELFLAEYDRKKKVQRGVFYTPKPVVSYIVRSVHELLQSEFKLEHGLADTTTWGEMVRKTPGLKLPNVSGDPERYEPISEREPFVQILDPAVGTATFLVEVIDVMYRHLKSKWDKAGFKEMPELPATSFPRQPTDFSEYWNQYVAFSLLPRLHGFELMMAPYAIAHMKIGLKLWETGYRFAANERAHIYLTNSLESPSDIQRDLPTLSPALAHEATAVNEVKRKKRFTVVIGNPPYANFGQLNRIPFILGLLDDYKRGLAEKKINLDDDFIKFVRLSQYLLTHTSSGVHGMITNNVYLDGITHRRMRQSLLETFQSIQIYDLHGSARKLETDREEPEENVFEIQQGVAIGIFSRVPSRGHEQMSHADLWGTRESKYQVLGSSTVRITPWQTLNPVPPQTFFVPKDFSSGSEYQQFPSLGEAFRVFQNGLKTDRDNLFFDFDRSDLEARIKRFYGKKYDSGFVKQFAIHASSSYDIEARRDETHFSPNKIHQCLYRPFDIRWLYYDPNLTSRPASKVMQHQLAGSNVALVCLRQTRRNEVGTFLVSRQLINKDAVSLFDIGTVFPLYFYDKATSFSQTKRPNLGDAFLKKLAIALQLPQGGSDLLPAKLTPEDIFNFCYAIFHSPAYRSRYAEFLKIDFPRVPLTGNLELFRALAKLGGELVDLHLLESPKLDKPLSKFIGGRNAEVEKVSYSKDTVWIDKARTIGFRGVPEEVWNFRIGGYQVCEKWLKDRKGRTLSKADIAHYHKIVIALSETIRLMSEIDNVIEKHGGFPGAFQ